MCRKQVQETGQVQSNLLSDTPSQFTAFFSSKDKLQHWQGLPAFYTFTVSVVVTQYRAQVLEEKYAMKHF